MNKRTIVTAAATAAALLVGTVAGSSVVSAGETNEAPESRIPETPAAVTPEPGTMRIAATSSDAVGGPSWVVRRSDGKAGGVCHSVARQAGDKLGTVIDGRFVETPEPRATNCGTLEERDPALLAAFTYQGRIVIYGIAGPDVLSASIGGQEVAIDSRERGFMRVVAGEPDELKSYPIELRLRNGTTYVTPWTGPSTIR